MARKTVRFETLDAAVEALKEKDAALRKAEALAAALGNAIRDLERGSRSREAIANDLEDLRALAGEPPLRPTRWHEGMRAYAPATCWAYVNNNGVCILWRGHDNRKHEPVAEPEREGAE